MRLIQVQIASCFVLACSRFLAGTIDRVDHILLVELRLRSSDLLVRSHENSTIYIKSSYPSANRKIGTLAPINYALIWCEQVQNQREEEGAPAVAAWAEIKREMRAQFIPRHYQCDIFNKLQNLRQGKLSVEEYHKEMEKAMIRA